MSSPLPPPSGPAADATSSSAGAWRQPARWLISVGALLTILTALHLSVDARRPSREEQLARAFGAQVIDRVPAPDLVAERADGTRVRLSDLRGKVVFINFWATWCPPCRQEMPDFEKLAALMRHVPFEILAVSSDEGWDEINTFFGGEPTRMLVARDPTRNWGATFGTEKLPETYVVDREGRLRLRFVNIQPWTDERIHRYLEWLATSG